MLWVQKIPLIFPRDFPEEKNFEESTDELLQLRWKNYLFSEANRLCIGVRADCLREFRGGGGVNFGKGEAFLLTVGAFLLTVKILCLQSLKALIMRCTFPLQAKKL